MSSLQAEVTWQCVEHWAAERPDEEALVFGDERLTWADFADRVDRLAKGFLELGVKKGDRIAFLGMARNEFMISYMAAGKVGASWLGLSPKFSVEELHYMLLDCAPRVLISIREYLGRDLARVGADMVLHIPSIAEILVIGEPVEGMESFAAFSALPRSHLDAALAERAAGVCPEDEALMMYTSGSTGHPKGVIHTHRSITHSAQTEVGQFGLSPGDRMLVHFPINHVAADVIIGLTAIYAGATLVSMERFDPDESLRVVERERITLLGQIPAMYLLQMQRPAFRETDFSAVKLFVWSGASASRPLVEALAAIARRTGAQLRNAFGMTETGGLVTFSAEGDDPDLLLSSAGKPAPSYELRIVDESRKEVDFSTVGEIAVRGRNLMKGYWKDPEATAAVMDDDGWFYTSDLAYRDARGYIHLVGRKSEMYKTGGENVFPREVEAVVETHPAIAAVAVVGVPNDVYGEVGRAFVMVRSGHTVTEHELKAFCQSHLANFKIPKRFDVLPHLPMLPNGKIDKRALRAGVAAMEG